MCDYSLQGIRNRLAREGEPLIVHRFNTGSKGLTSPEYLDMKPKPKGLMAIFRSMFGRQPNECAVCIPDGAKLGLEEVHWKLRSGYRLDASEVVTFRQLSAEAHTYRDAIEFKNGTKLRLQDLEEGQRLQVLALSSEKIAHLEEPIIPVW
jgi:hypothetical protein